MYYLKALIAFVIISTFAIHQGNAQTTTNYALSGTATQSSIAHSGAASRAIDGNTSGRYGDKSTTHTLKDPESWWQVDLGQVVSIDSINAWNRTDCCAYRATDYYVFVSDTPFTSTSVAGTLAQSGVLAIRNTGQMGIPSTHSINRTGRYVRIQLVKANYLHMAEVEVIGTASNPSISVSKTADKKVDVAAGEQITYTYIVENTGDVPLSNIQMSDVHNAYGAPPVPKAEKLTDKAPIGDSTDTTPNDGIWSKLAPGDIVTMKGYYTVRYEDIEKLQ